MLHAAAAAADATMKSSTAVLKMTTWMPAAAPELPAAAVDCPPQHQRQPLGWAAARRARLCCRLHSHSTPCLGMPVMATPWT